MTDAGEGNTSLAIGGTATAGNISLGAGQTSGILNIGTGTRTTSGSGGGINIGTGSSTANVITIGSATTSTVLNGIIVSNGLILIGGLAHVSITANYTVPSIASPYSSSMPNKDFYIFNQSSATITITLPLTPVSGQIIHIRNASNSSITISGNGKNLYPNVSTGNIFTTWSVFATNTSQNFEYNGTGWIGH